MEAPRSLDEVAMELQEAMARHSLPIAELEARVANLPEHVFVGWEPKPLLAPKGPAPLVSLAFAVLSEQAAKRLGKSPEQLAVMASTSAGAYADLDQLALAQRAQARAHDYVSRIASPELRQKYGVAIASADFEIMRRCGESVKAGEALARALTLLDANEPLTSFALQGSAGILQYRQGQVEEAVQTFQGIESLAHELAERVVARSGDDFLNRLTQSQVSKFFNGYSNALALAVELLEHGAASATLHGRLLGLVQTQPGRCSSPNPIELEDLCRSLHTICHELLLRAIAHAEAIHSYEFLGSQHYNLGLVLQKLDRQPEAFIHLARASGYAQRVPGHPMATEIAVALADAASARGDGAAALEHWRAVVCNEMRKVLEHAGSRNTQDEATIIHAVIRTTQRGADTLEAILLAESMKGIAQARTIARGLPAFDVHAALSAALHALHSRREALRCAAIDGADSAAELHAVDLELELVRGELRIRSQSLSDWTNAFGVEPTRARILYEALREYGPNTLLLGSVGASGREIWVYGISRDDIVLVTAPRPTRGADLKELAHALLRPVERLLKKLSPSDRVIFTGPQTLPLASMPFLGRPLCEHATISFVHSVGVLLSLQRRPQRALNTALFVGDPTRADASPLPGAANEARQLAELFEPCSATLIGSDATIQALRAGMDADIVHIAAHASSAFDAGRHWGTIWLAPDGYGDSGELSEDRILEELVLQEGAFVNLATCVSAAQQERPGFVDGGLVNAFLAAGACSVLATTRSIDDQDAVAFQLAFYERLEAGKTPAVSLAETQRACVRGDLGSSLREEEVWGAFHLYGAG